MNLNKNILLYLLLLLPFSVVHATAKPTFNPVNLHIRWQFVSNSNDGKSGSLASLTLINKGKIAIPSNGWKLYFSLRYQGVNLATKSSDVSINHVNGELFFIQPSKDFKGLVPGQSITFQYHCRGAIANYQDAPEGFFWVAADNIPHNIPVTNIIRDPGTLKGVDGQVVFDQNREISDVPLSKLPPILPAPISLKKNKGSFIWDKSVSITAPNEFKSEVDYLSQEIKSVTGLTLSAGGNKKVIFHKNKLQNEAYDLTVTPDSIVISASTGAGIFYGIQSLKNLMPANTWATNHTAISIPCVTIHDAPRFPVRAFMLDVSRNFQSKQEILKLLDLMALYKLNMFHFHFTDDEGWRIEIPGLPELTSVGSNRGYPFDKDQRLQPSYGSGAGTSNKMGSGYYSRKDYIEILKYAKERHIKIVPEIESPGHSRAAVRSMLARYQKYMKLDDRKKAEEYLLTDLADSSKYTSAQYFNDNVMNPALPSTYRFVQKVIDELTSMYREAGAELDMIHMGGDEVPNGAWEKSPKIQAMMKNDTSLHNINDVFLSYFMKVKNILDKHHLTLYAWEELTIGTEKNDNARKVLRIPPFVKGKVNVDAWFNVEGNEDIPYQAANTGYKTMLTCLDYFYFDLAWQRSFHEPGDEWLGFINTKKVLSFIPYDYYRNATINFAGKPFPPGYFDKKIKLTPQGRENVNGIQGALWSEDIRSAKQMEYMILPRMIALAEKSWAKEPDWEIEQDTAASAKLYDKYWNVFANQLGKRELPKLAYYHGGYNFWIPSAGMNEKNGMIQVNQQFPGMTIRYTTNGSEPNSKSTVYTQPLKIKSTIKAKVFDAKGRSGETTSIIVN